MAAETWRGESIGERKIGFFLPSVRDHRRWFVTESARWDDIERAAWKLSSGTDRGYCYDPEKWASSLVVVHAPTEGWNSIDFIEWYDPSYREIIRFLFLCIQLKTKIIGSNAIIISLNICISNNNYFQFQLIAKFKADAETSGIRLICFRLIKFSDNPIIEILVESCTYLLFNSC